MTETTRHHGGEAAAGGLPGFVHIAPFRILAAVWVTLLVLTWVTVSATGLDLGRFNLWLAMAIATVKASLVLLYFMHMRYDRPINAIVFVTALLFVMLFVGFALMDTLAYQPDMIPGYAPGIAR